MVTQNTLRMCGGKLVFSKKKVTYDCSWSDHMTNSDQLREIAPFWVTILYKYYGLYVLFGRQEIFPPKRSGEKLKVFNLFYTLKFGQWTTMMKYIFWNFFLTDFTCKKIFDKKYKGQKGGKGRNNFFFIPSVPHLISMMNQIYLHNG